MAQPQNKANPRDDVYQMRCYKEDKLKAMERAREDGDSLGYLMNCFLAGYANGYTLPEWIDEIKLEERKPVPDAP